VERMDFPPPAAEPPAWFSEDVPASRTQGG
jgi:hypothetical protein